MAEKRDKYHHQHVSKRRALCPGTLIDASRSIVELHPILYCPTLAPVHCTKAILQSRCKHSQRDPSSMALRYMAREQVSWLGTKRTLLTSVSRSLFWPYRDCWSPVKVRVDAVLSISYHSGNCFSQELSAAFQFAY